MGRKPCCDMERVKKGAWSAEEDLLLVQYIKKNGPGCWHTLAQRAGLNRCGKSCRLRWKNYLEPSISLGPLSSEEKDIIIRLQRMIGNRWAGIASYLPGRTGNQIKNFWHQHVKKRLLLKGKIQETKLRGPSGTKSMSMSLLNLRLTKWERAARLKTAESSLLCSSSSAGRADCDIFIKLWNSEVGERFRKIPQMTKKDGEAPKTSASQISSFVRHESPSNISNSTVTSQEQGVGYRPELDTQNVLALINL